MVDNDKDWMGPRTTTTMLITRTGPGTPGPRLHETIKKQTSTKIE